MQVCSLKNADSTLFQSLYIWYEWNIYIFYELIFSASTEMYGLRIAIWAQAPAWNMTNARTPFPTTFWDATITLTHSHPTSLWENVSISKMATDSVWLDVSKHAERLVLCLRDWGKLFIEILIHSFIQGSSVLPLWQCWTTNRVQSRLGEMWNILP